MAKLAIINNQLRQSDLLDKTMAEFILRSVFLADSLMRYAAPTDELNLMANIG